MQKKLLTLLLCSAVCVCGFTGCGNETQDTPDNTQSTTQEQTETSEITTTEESTEPTSEENTSSFNMDETLENTLLCGVKLSPDMTLGMLGEDFTIEDTETSYSEKRNALTCLFDFKGQRVGSISFKDCKESSDVNSDSLINDILITNKDTGSFDIPKISVYGVTINENRSKLYENLGEPQLVYGDDESVKYFNKEDGRVLSCAFTDDIITIISISLQNQEKNK